MELNKTEMSLQEWPTLDDVNRRTVADGRSPQNMRNGSNESGTDAAAGSASSTENGGSNSDNNNIKVGKKNRPKRVEWKKLTFETRPYRQRGSGRRFNDFTSKTFENGHSDNSDGNNNSTNGVVNGRTNFRGRNPRSYRNNRNIHRQRREATDDSEYPSDIPIVGHCIHGTYYFPRNSGELKILVRRQIEYWLSEENLITDIYLRQKMNDQGFVPITLLATFGKLKQMTDDMEIILEAVRESSKLELKDDYLVRPIIDPLRWILLPNQYEKTALEDASDDGYEKTSLRIDVPEFFPGQPYFGVDDITQQMSDLHMNGNTMYHYLNGQFPLDTVENVNGFSVIGANVEQDGIVPYVSNPTVIGVVDAGSPVQDPIDQEVYGAIAGAPEQLIYTFSNNSSPVEQINGFEYFSEPVENGVVFYNNDQQSNGGSCYSILNPAEELPDVVDSSTENIDDDNDTETLHNKSPEPSR